MEALLAGDGFIGVQVARNLAPQSVWSYPLFDHRDHRVRGSLPPKQFYKKAILPIEECIATSLAGNLKCAHNDFSLSFCEFSCICDHIMRSLYRDPNHRALACLRRLSGQIIET